jgi:hypothetical protein
MWRLPKKSNCYSSGVHAGFTPKGGGGPPPHEDTPLNSQGHAASLESSQEQVRTLDSLQEQATFLHETALISW